MVQIWMNYAAGITGGASLSGLATVCLPIARHHFHAFSVRLRHSWAGTATIRPLLLFGAATLICFALVPHEASQSRLMMTAITFAAVLSSIAGFAFSAICGAVLFHMSSDTVHIVQVMITCSIANQAAMTWAFRRHIDWRGLWPFLAGGVFGLPIGVSLLLYVDRVVYTRGLGILLIVYAGGMLCRKPIIIRGKWVAIDVATAVLGGITGGAAGFPSGFVTMWCGMRGWGKSRQRAIAQPFILLMQVASLALITLWRSGGAAVGFDPANLLFVPAGLLGTSIGLALYRRLSDANFAHGLNLSLLGSGLSFVL